MIGKKIAELRKAKNLSLDKLSKKTAIAKSYLHDLEKGKAVNPTAIKILALATALDVSVKFLMDDEQSQSKEEGVLYIKFNKLGNIDKKRIIEIMDLWSKK